ncbi:hypothetical protein LSAT2_012512 [Lamellibrachia satsuma]|nr:hypothetical protein LSAT2_012512 [Lamellibrachia satsuma]
MAAHLTVAAPVIDSVTIRCDQQLCDAKREYCDPLIMICTPCEQPCSRTTVSDRKLCKRQCRGYKKLGVRSTTFTSTATTTTTEAAAVAASATTKHASVLYDKEKPYATVSVSVVVVAVVVLPLALLVVFVVPKFKQRNATSSRRDVPDQTPMNRVFEEETEDVLDQTPMNRVFTEETEDVPEETPLNRVFEEETSPGATSDFTHIIDSGRSNKKQRTNAPYNTIHGDADVDQGNDRCVAAADDEVTPARTTPAN